MYKVKVENLSQLEVALNSKNAGEIILARDSFAESDLPKLVSRVKKAGKLAWILMERISRYEEKLVSGGCKSCEPISLRLSTDKIYELQNLDGIIIQNLDSFAYMFRRINTAANKKLMVELNYTMNVYNYETKLVLETIYNNTRKNAKDAPLLFTAPVELNIHELSDVTYDTMLLYSYIDTMVSANCLYKDTVGARQKLVGASSASPLTSSYIIDRKGKRLHYKTYCKYCYNKIFNTEPLFLIDKIDEISKHLNMGLNSSTVGASIASPFRIDFSFENEKEVKSILKGTCPESFTRGHYKTSIK